MSQPGGKGGPASPQEAYDSIMNQLQQQQEALEAHRSEIVAQNERYKKLIDDLTTQFNALSATQSGQHAALEAGRNETRMELLEVKDALEATRAQMLSMGIRGGPSDALLDPRFMDKPGRFNGKLEEWQDWSEAMQGFCEVANATMGRMMKEAAKAETVVVMAAMTEEQRKVSTQLNYMLIMLCKGKAATRRRNITDKGNGHSPLECLL